MRETDQASLLSGALDIAWSGDVVGNEAYRYDKFYGSYLILAAFFKSMLLQPGVEPMRVVLLGNILAGVFFLFAISHLLWRQKMPLALAAVVFIGLSSPVLILSMTLASPNIFSISALLFCITLLRKKKSAQVNVELFIAAFLAVACRADAILIFPLLCALSDKKNVIQFWKNKRSLVMFVAAVSALLVGRILGTGHEGGVGESMFFQPKVAAAYLLFGVGVSLGLLGVFSASLLLSLRVKRMAIGFFALLPLLFYLGLLFSPRHLLLLPVVVIATAMLPRGRKIWMLWARKIWVRWGLAIAVVLAIGFMFIGVRMPEVGKVKMVSSFPSQYPTADGYWPMGATVPYLFELGNIENASVDHNQEVWESWSKVEFTEDSRVLWDPLYAYPRFAAKSQGIEVEYVQKMERGCLYLERAVRRHDVERGEVEPMKTKWITSSESVGGNNWILQYLVAQTTATPLDSGKEARLLAAEYSRANDIVFLDQKGWMAQSEKLVRYMGHDTLLISSNVLKDAGKLLGEKRGLFVYASKFSFQLPLREGVWIAIYRLPPYMKASEYGKE